LLKHPSLSKHSLIAHLYLHHGSALLEYLRRQVSSREDAEDLLLEVFLAAMESDTLYRIDEQQQKAWLWSVAHNKVIDQYRRAKHRQAAPLADVEETLYEDELFAPETLILRQEAQDVLRACVSSLTEEQQQILSLRFAQGLRCTEIARLLNKHDSTLRTMLSRTLNILRKNFKESSGEK
jgi:RNA polymerase sigma-70 factor (ECF subfamily)